jgi:queuine tRNA-ribosyltransferase
MLAAGFYVARGRSAGDKDETTIALTPAAWAGGLGRPYELLSSPWLAKWHRSGAKFPSDLSAEAYPGFERLILQHPQFHAAAAER